MQLEYHEINPTTSPSHIIIWLHGLGSDGFDLISIVPALKLPQDRAIRHVFPHAPLRPITINGGMNMRGWYDIYGFSVTAPEDHQGVEQMSLQISHLIERESEMHQIPSERIFLAGFSQGGAIALYTALRLSKKLAGVLACSTYLPCRNTLNEKEIKQAKTTPFHLMHGTKDDVVPITWGLFAAHQLRNWQYPVEWNEYPIGHNICGDAVADANTWLAHHLQNE